MARGLRVTGGELCGRRLAVPSRGVRPTSDRVREALFARLGDLRERQVLDLFAGSGALGIESLSRGAARATFVERDASVAAILRSNLAALDLGGHARVLQRSALAALAELGRAGVRFDLVFLDPPYAGADAEEALVALVRCGLLASDARVIWECSRRQPAPRIPGLDLLDERRYGDTLLRRFQLGADAAPAGRAPQPAPGGVEGG